MTEVYRADVVGSLLAPEYIKRARTEWEAGRMALQVVLAAFRLRTTSSWNTTRHQPGSLQAIAAVPEDKVVVLLCR